MKKFMVHDDNGNVLGMGMEEDHTQRLSPNLEMTQTIVAGVGTPEGNKVEIDDALFDEINDPGKGAFLKDFKVVKGKLKKL